MKIFSYFVWSTILLNFFVNRTLGEESEVFEFPDLDASEHEYWERPVNDPFSALIGKLESGAVAQNSKSEKEYLIAILDLLEIPVSSQILVFSTTSLQLSLISPRSPRALYFNEEIYLGYVPGGKIEIISMDPELGGVFYIFDIPRTGQVPEVQRSRRCMNCHSDDDTRGVPGLVVKSVIPGPRGGSLESYRRYRTGHDIPFSERFGGWYVSGGESLGAHWGNVIGRFTPEGIVTTPVEPGKTFDWSIFPVESSDLLPHLLHEHQAGFVNLILELQYRTRTGLKRGGGSLVGRDAVKVDELSNELVRYLLFADEAAFPAGGVRGDERFKSEFLSSRVKSGDGTSLKDFDLESRMFRNRCSYMIYSGLFRGLNPAAKTLVLQKLNVALSSDDSESDFDYLPSDEKRSILKILRETHPDWKNGR